MLEFIFISTQKTAFLKLFSKKLTEEELESKFFKKEYKEIDNTKDKSRYTTIFKNIDSLKNVIDDIMENIKDSDYEDFNVVRNYLLTAEEILIKQFDNLRKS